MAVGQLYMFTIDAEDVPASAIFWSQVLGYEIQHSEDDYAMVGNGATSIGFGRIDDYSRPSWPTPSVPKQFHLDLAVDDMAAAEAQCLELGATRPDHQPGDGKWTVLLDPSGHPFCIFPKPE